MSRCLKILAIGTFALVMLAPVASARPRVLIGGGFGYGGLYAPYWGWGPAYGYVGPYGYYGAPNAGEVKITTHDKDAKVYVDGGYAGLVSSLKKFPLKAGEHNIELRDATGHAFYQERVSVIPGRTLEIKPDLN